MSILSTKCFCLSSSLLIYLICEHKDFGLSHVKQEKGDKKYAVGQIPWMAPEGNSIIVFFLPQTTHSPTPLSFSAEKRIQLHRKRWVPFSFGLRLINQLNHQLMYIHLGAFCMSYGPAKNRTMASNLSDMVKWYRRATDLTCLPLCLPAGASSFRIVCILYQTRDQTSAISSKGLIHWLQVQKNIFFPGIALF